MGWDRASAPLESSSWLFVLLVMLTLVPSAGVLWFMNEAMTGDATAAHQRVLEAYRGQLRLVRSRLDGVWRAHASRLDAHGNAEMQFADVITSGVAEGALFLDANGAVVYPRADVERDGSVAELERRATALPLLAPPSRADGIATLAARLNDYTTPLPPAARLMLMDRVRAVSPNVWLSTQAALHLSMDLLDAERPAPVPDVVRQTALHDVWALTSSDRRVIGLYRTGRIEAMMHDFLHEISPAGVVFIAYPPDVRADAEAIAAGRWLPGWQLSFVPLDLKNVDAIATRRRTIYLSVAIAGIGVIVVAGGLASGGVRRHLRLAKLKTDLVASASHELRTPLASMRVLVDGLLADRALDPVKTREYLQLLATENARLSRLIDNFLTFSKLDRRRYEFSKAPVAPAAIVEATAAAVRDRLPPACALDVTVGEALPPVHADAEALTMALVNLVDNAIKYTPADKQIAIRVAMEPDGLLGFAVRDNGIGIPSAERRRIFRRFYRVDQRLARQSGGVGLGLSIVELVVHAHGGSIQVESEVGKGSTFTIRIPAIGSGAVV